MTNPDSRHIIGENIALKEIEASFQEHWRNVVDGDQAVMKASTLNLLVFVKDEANIENTVKKVHEVIAHHPGRVIIAHANTDPNAAEISAHLSAYSQKSKEGQTQIAAEFIILNTGAADAGHLAGAILPMLLPDVPVFFWCANIENLFHPNFKTLLQYTDRLIIHTPLEFESMIAFRNTIKDILNLQKECKISDLRWSELTDWREAIAQFFDSEHNLKLLSKIEEVEVSYAGEKISNHAFLMAGWLSETLKNIRHDDQNNGESIIFHNRQVGRATIKINKSSHKDMLGLLSIKMIAKDGGKTIIFTVKADPENDIKATIQIGGNLYPETVVRRTSINDAHLLCDELDFVQQDEIYLNSFQAISEYLNEN